MIPRTAVPRIWRLALALAIGAAPAACQRARPIRIGVALDPAAREGALLAAEDLDAAGGVGGRRVELILDTVRYDRSTDATLARAARLAAAGVAVVVSDNNSQQSLVLGSVLNERGIVQICANSTSPRIHGLGPWSYALAPDDNRNGRYLALRIHAGQPGARTAIVYLNAAYGEGLRRGVDSALAALGDSVTWELPFTDTAALPGLLALAAGGRGGQAVVLASYWEGLEAAAAALERWPAVTRPRLYAGDAAVPVTPRAGTDGVRIVAFWTPDLGDSGSRGFAAGFARRYGHPPRPVDAMNYDAVRLAAQAIAATDGSAGAVRDFLESLGGRRPPLPGLSGPISFRDRRRVGAHAFLAEYRGGALHVLPAEP